MKQYSRSTVGGTKSLSSTANARLLEIISQNLDLDGTVDEILHDLISSMVSDLWLNSSLSIGKQYVEYGLFVRDFVMYLQVSPKGNILQSYYLTCS